MWQITTRTLIASGVIILRLGDYDPNIRFSASRKCVTYYSKIFFFLQTQRNSIFEYIMHLKYLFQYRFVVIIYTRIIIENNFTGCIIVRSDCGSHLFKHFIDNCIKRVFNLCVFSLFTSKRNGQPIGIELKNKNKITKIETRLWYGGNSSQWQHWKNSENTHGVQRNRMK